MPLNVVTVVCGHLETMEILADSLPTLQHCDLNKMEHDTEGHKVM